ncbi:MAG: hypothetical protein CL816_08140 [Coxiellaceae bacterium]|nr:hypothetical protein [Coxiellaceae bacterium]|tara:strand:+ start:1870 stop:3381 length:1512 start_codon:yes stop_codon:yes gene_type:complete
MTFAAVQSRTIVGVSTSPVRIEVHLSRGLPSFTMVGLPEKAVKESKDRVRSALLNAGFEFPTKRIVVNLSPADLPKEGSRFDVPMALGILIASGQLHQDSVKDYECMGELTLDGQLLSVPGILPIALAVQKSRAALLVPQDNVAEASVIQSIRVFGAATLLSVCQHLKGIVPIPPNNMRSRHSTVDRYLDMKDVKGQAQGRRALEIAACGGHSLLLRGPPGAGKSMLASRLPGLLSPMTVEQAEQTAAIYSVSQNGFHSHQWLRRPFRAPHHTASCVALVGGGNPPRPGEISLAHHGVLFLDELPEFHRTALEALREPLENGFVSIARSSRCVKFPAQFQLVVAMNPCPCGYASDEYIACQCNIEGIRRYQMKLSGPLLDRLDIHIEIPRLQPQDWFGDHTHHQESSDTIRQRIMEAQLRQLERNKVLNARMTSHQLSACCAINPSTQRLLERAMTLQHFSGRTLHRLLSIARTIADLSGLDKVCESHVLEALSYRALSSVAT